VGRLHTSRINPEEKHLSFILNLPGRFTFMVGQNDWQCKGWRGPNNAQNFNIFDYLEKNAFLTK
jgi:hypothetical protein